MLNNVISLQKSKKKSAFVCYIDAKKAFDSINRACLWYKIQKIGINGKFLKAIQSLYDDVTCAVRINGALSNFFPVENGVKQGCLLSPALFSIYVNDLATEIKNLQCGIHMGDRNISIMMFADDIALISDSEANLQKMIDHVNIWCKRWRLRLNLEKTKIVHYRHTSQPRTEHVFKYGHENIGLCDKYKYLGLYLNEFLDYGVTVRHLSTSANRALGALHTKVKLIGGMAYDIYSKLYNSLVTPVLNYGSALWGTANYRCANTIQNRACRFFLGVGSHTSTNAIRAEMGWSPQLHKQYIEVLRLYCRLRSLEPGRLARDVHISGLGVKCKSIWESRVTRLSKSMSFTLPVGEFRAQMF